MKTKNSGFTLVELLAVIIILAIVITVASSAVFSIMNKSKANMAREVRYNLAESAIPYVLENSHLSVCSPKFSEEMYINKNTTNLDANTSCTKKVTVGELLDAGIFEDKRGFCSREDIVIVYRYNDGKNSEYKAYVSENICNR